MNDSNNYNSILALLSSGMGFMLLLVLVLFERSSFDLLFDINAEDNASVTNVFNALRMVINVMPYTLGPFILGTFIFGFIQSYKSRWKLLPTTALLLFTIAIVYNIAFADTAGVVETLKNTTINNTIELVRYATQGVMRQHHIGIIGFFIFLVCQIFYVFTNEKKLIIINRN